MIRNILPKDLPKLKELADWEFGPDYLKGLVLVDSSDEPIVFVGAWQLAEVHLAMNPSWGTPGARLAALKEIHAAMERELSALKVGQVVTWFEKCSAFTRRMKQLGWVMSEKISWHRGINGSK